jgi:PAS domain S-box-containing protein
MDSGSKEQGRELENLRVRLEEAEQLIEAIKKGEVDAFAISSGVNAEVYTLRSGDYAYRMLVEMMREGAANITEDGLIVYSNPYLLELFQLPYADVVGTLFIDFVHPDSREKFSRLFSEALAGQSKEEINLRVKGHTIPVYVSLTLLELDVPTIGVIITDLNEKKRAEKVLKDKTNDLIRTNRELIHTKTFLDNILTSTDHGVLSYKAIRENGEVVDMEIRYANDKALEQIPYPADRIIGGRYLEIFPNAKEVGAWQRVMRVMSTGERETYEVTSPRHRHRSFMVNYVAMEDGVTCTFIEITEQKNQARELEEKNSELLRNNSELASFAYIASHDLQEPLRKIQMFAARIVEKELQNLSVNGQDYFKRMEAAAHRMQTLIEDLLSYSRTNTLERKFEKTDISKIVRAVQVDLREEIYQKQASIHVPDSLEINVISFQFRQLLYNLISNSLKFASPARKPEIKIKTKKGTGKNLGYHQLVPDQEYIQLDIEDNGIGFEQEYSEKIFQLFKRLHLKSEYPGTGIGLAIVKKIVENHGGQIIADGKKDEGATFHIFIPSTETVGQ